MYNETRLNVRTNLMAYITTTFSTQLQNEFKKYESKKHSFTFELTKNKWSVVTGTKIKYSALGYRQHDDKENIEHIDLGIILSVNEKLAGEFLISFTPDNGFYNLEECVKKAIASLDLNELPDTKHSHAQFSIKNIINSQPIIPETVETDPRFDDIINALTLMNYSKRKAEMWAHNVILNHPDIHDIDTLVDEILHMSDNNDLL